ncbi:glycosyltransferase [Psychrobacter faecalis]
MAKKKIVHVITNFHGIGGAEIMLTRLIDETKSEYEHTIISLMQISDRYQSTLDICEFHYQLDWNGVNTPKILIKLRQLLNTISPDIIQCWMYHANVLTTMSMVGVRNSPPIFWGVHHSLTSVKEESTSTKFALTLSKTLSKLPTGLVYCARSSRNQHESFGVKNTNTHVIANGIFLSNFSPKLEINDPLVIGFAGRYHTAKGYPYLFETIASLKGYPIIFKIAGKDTELTNPEIKKYFDKYNLDESKVQLLGHVSDMPEFYRSIDAFLMTSITEGFPNVLVEAMASGVPCITTDVGDAGFIVSDTGYVVPSRDVPSLTNAIKDYFDLNESDKMSLKKAARTRVEKNFSINQVSQEYIDVWER